MGENTFAKEKEVFAAALKKAGYEVADDHGVVVALVGAEGYSDAKKKVGEIVKQVGYELSYGVKAVYRKA